MCPSVDTEIPNEELQNVQENAEQLKEVKPQEEAISESNFLTSMLLGSALSSAFLTLAIQSPEGSTLQRYFLGHPIAMTATVLFWFASSILVLKCVWLISQKRQLTILRDEDFSPELPNVSPSENWYKENHAGYVARAWDETLKQLPPTFFNNLFVKRLAEVVHRQSQRGSSKHLADDLRELSNRDADAAHDSYGLVRIISWAIPMLGFLGTVIGITQTLGGLDFSNGTAAVENLKSGLYVAFDTTAVGLVLSVLAIFIQFPIERAEQRLLAVVDSRVGNLVSSHLPNADEGRNETELVSYLIDGVKTAIAESMNQQASLWRETISEADQYWKNTQTSQAAQIKTAIESALTPAIVQFSDGATQAFRAFTDGLENHSRSMANNSDRFEQNAQQLFQSSHQDLTDQLNQSFNVSLERQEQILDDAINSIQQLHQAWSSSIVSLQSAANESEVNRQREHERTARDHTESLLLLQKSLDANLTQLSASNNAIKHQLSNDLSSNLTEAMRYLARSVDQLSKQLSDDQGRNRSVRPAA